MKAERSHAMNYETGGLIRHPTLGIGRLVPAELEFDGLESEQEIIGTDDRVIVADTKKIPYRWVCSLDLYFEDPDNRKQAILLPATGTLISEKHVLTCAHALFNDIEGTKGTIKRLKAKRVTVIPGRWGGARTEAEQQPFGSSDSASLDFLNEWKRMLDPIYDFGLIKLKKPLGRPPLGYWGSKAYERVARIQAVPKATLRGRPVHSSGYPGDKCGHLPKTGSAPDAKTNPCPNRGSTQWRTSGRVLSTPGTNRLDHDLDTKPGQSGSPLWLEDPATGALTLIAIHSAPNDGTSNRAVLLTEEVLRQVKKWM
jgi:V8-like Glu-specific endopeptidase